MKYALSPTQYLIRPFAFAVFLCLAASLPSSAQPGGDWPRVEKELQQAINTGTPEEKRDTLFRIRNLANERASRLAVPALRDADELVRATATGSVVFLPAEEAIDVILPLLDDPRPFVRKETAYALGRVGHSSSSPRLVAAMQRDIDIEVRTAAAIAIGLIGDPAALSALIGILETTPREENEVLRRSAARAIGQVVARVHGSGTYTLTPQNFLPEKYKTLSSGNSASSGAAPKPDFTRAVAVLTSVLNSTGEAADTRREAAFALGEIGDPGSVPALERYLSGPDPYLVEICREALLKIAN
jgi:HEAT repeat protein